jgi:hypothetical protein
LKLLSEIGLESESIELRIKEPPVDNSRLTRDHWLIRLEINEPIVAPYPESARSAKVRAAK